MRLRSQAVGFTWLAARHDPSEPLASSMDAATLLARFCPASDTVGTCIHRLSAIVP